MTHYEPTNPASWLLAFGFLVIAVAVLAVLYLCYAAVSGAAEFAGWLVNSGLELENDDH